MKKIYTRTLSLLPSATILLATAFSPAQAQSEDLIYVAVEPCRIVDTRKGIGSPIPNNDHMNFLVSGTSGDLFDQGGSQSGGCAAPKQGQTPAAISAYVVAVPAATSVGNGVLVAYPSDQQEPPEGAAATVNFTKGQIIGNTTNITLCTADDCPTDGQFAIKSRNTDEHVVVDVQGYFYPLPRTNYQEILTGTEVGPAGSVTAYSYCPEGTRVIDGGYSLSPVDGSYQVTTHVSIQTGEGERDYRMVEVRAAQAGRVSVFAVCVPR